LGKRQEKKERRERDRREGDMRGRAGMIAKWEKYTEEEEKKYY
jgi:hypothetical protein